MIYYLVGMLTGSSLTVSKPSFDPKRVKSFIRTTAPTRQKRKRKADVVSKLNIEYCSVVYHCSFRRRVT